MPSTYHLVRISWPTATTLPTAMSGGKITAWGTASTLTFADIVFGGSPYFDLGLELGDIDLGWQGDPYEECVAPATAYEFSISNATRFVAALETGTKPFVLLGKAIAVYRIESDAQPYPYAMPAPIFSGRIAEYQLSADTVSIQCRAETGEGYDCFDKVAGKSDSSAVAVVFGDMTDDDAFVPIASAEKSAAARSMAELGKSHTTGDYSAYSIWTADKSKPAARIATATRIGSTIYNGDLPVVGMTSTAIAASGASEDPNLAANASIVVACGAASRVLLDYEMMDLGSGLPPAVIDGVHLGGFAERGSQGTTPTAHASGTTVRAVQDIAPKTAQWTTAALSSVVARYIGGGGNYITASADIAAVKAGSGWIAISTPSDRTPSTSNPDFCTAAVDLLIEDAGLDGIVEGIEVDLDISARVPWTNLTYGEAAPPPTTITLNTATPKGPAFVKSLAVGASQSSPALYDFSTTARIPISADQKLSPDELAKSGLRVQIRQRSYGTGINQAFVKLRVKAVRILTTEKLADKPLYYKCRAADRNLPANLNRIFTAYNAPITTSFGTTATTRGTMLDGATADALDARELLREACKSQMLLALPISGTQWAVEPLYYSSRPIRTDLTTDHVLAKPNTLIPDVSVSMPDLSRLATIATLDWRHNAAQGAFAISTSLSHDASADRWGLQGQPHPDSRVYLAQAADLLQRPKETSRQAKFCRDPEAAWEIIREMAQHHGHPHRIAEIAVHWSCPAVALLDRFQFAANVSPEMQGPTWTLIGIRKSPKVGGKLVLRFWEE